MTSVYASARNGLLHALAPLSKEDRMAAIEEWEERSGLMQHLGEVSRDHAEWAAARLVAKRRGLEMR